MQSYPAPEASSSQSHSTTRSLFIRNPKGKNQYKDCPDKDDARVADLLISYHRRGITDRKTVSKLLHAEHGITMSVSTVARRRKVLGLRGSGATTRVTPDGVKRQLVLDQMAKDPTRKHGPRTIKEAIASETGVHLTRDYIANEMRAYDPEGFALRDPAAGRRDSATPHPASLSPPDTFPSSSLLPSPPASYMIPPSLSHLPSATHLSTAQLLASDLFMPAPAPVWTCAHGEPLAAFGFPLWCVRDTASGRWLGMWVVPAVTAHAYKAAIGYLKLGLIGEIGGMPPPPETPEGEDPPVCEYIDALSPSVVQGASFEEWELLKSIAAFPVERSAVHEQWAREAAAVWEAGARAGVYAASDHRHYELAQWLWSKTLQLELDRLRARLNAALPPHAHPQAPLRPVDRAGVRALLARADGEALLRFICGPYRARAEASLRQLGVRDEALGLRNVWAVFKALVPVLYPPDAVLCTLRGR